MSDRETRDGRKSRAQIHPRIPAETRQRLRAYASGNRRSESAVVQEALAKYLEDDNDVALIIRRMDALSQEVARIYRDLNVSVDAFGIFVQFWFAHTPQLAEGQKMSAERSALERYKRFVDHVAAKIASGAPLLRQLAPDRVTGAHEPGSPKTAPPKTGSS